MNDPKLPQLSAACDVTLMQRVFNESLLANSVTCRIDKCALSRIRYRRGQRAIVLYDLEVWSSATNTRQHRWVTGIVYAEPKRATRTYRRLCSGKDRKQIIGSGSHLLPFAFIDELDMLVQSFPFDRYLPGLDRLVNHVDQAVLRALWPELSEVSQKSRTALVPCWQALPMRYRPQLGATLKVGLTSVPFDAAHEHTEHLNVQAGLCEPRFVKIYRSDEVRGAYDFLRSIDERNSHQTEFSLVKPLCCLDEHHAVVLEQAQGVPFDRLMQQDNNVIDGAERIAVALAHFHAIGDIPGRVRTAEEFEQRARRAVMLLGWGDVLIGRQAQRLLDRSLPSLTFNSYHATHLDIKPDHVLLADRTVTFIDLDSSAMSDPIADVAMLQVRLQVMPSLDGVNSDTAQRASDAFISAYRRMSDKKQMQRLPVHQVLASLKLALFYMQHQTPDWQDHVAALLHRSSESFDQPIP